MSETEGKMVWGPALPRIRSSCRVLWKTFVSWAHGGHKNGAYRWPETIRNKLLDEIENQRLDQISSMIYKFVRLTCAKVFQIVKPCWQLLIAACLTETSWRLLYEIAPEASKKNDKLWWNKVYKVNKPRLTDKVVLSFSTKLTTNQTSQPVSLFTPQVPVSDQGLVTSDMKFSATPMVENLHINCLNKK